ncbi:MAG: diguanylate cyclase [Gaiellaceae bacterium]
MLRTRRETGVGLPVLPSAGASVIAASLLIGLSLGAACWAAESAAVSRMRTVRMEDVRNTLLTARNLVADKERAASAGASQLAGRKDVQAAFVGHDAAPLVAFARTHPSVGFSLWNGRIVGGPALAGPGAAVAVYSRGSLAGRVLVAVPPTANLLELARARSRPTHLLYLVDGRVTASSPPVAGETAARLLQDNLSDQFALNSLDRAVVKLAAYRARPHVPLQKVWPFGVALAAAVFSFRMFERRELRQRSKPPPNSVRDAVALVGETLAATHNTQALLPVILRAAVEATGAGGGTIDAGEFSLATRGTIPQEPVDTLQVELEVSEGVTAVMTLFSSDAGFGADARDAVAWIAEQALIALENARLHGLVQRQAVTDELTGLANRRRFLSQLETEIARSRRSGSPLGIIVADLDDFKRINDTYGHEAGDEALCSFAEILTTIARDVDLPVRLGGEEFAVLLPDTDLAGAAQLAERLRSALESAAIGPEETRLTASFGVSSFPAAAAAEDLLTEADRRLYDAKHAGKNRVVASIESGGVRPA